jgi:diacylglycerol kinase
MRRKDKDGLKMGFNLTGRLRSFKDAIHGVGTLLRYEHNARIHLFFLILVIIAGIFLRISGSDWMAILFVSALVFISECFNTAVEYLSDFLTDDYNVNIKRAKDVAAAGVLISAVISVITGLIVFLPEIFRVVRSCTR